jgi:citrate lyase subunit beta/citryl-CoA lyase
MLKAAASDADEVIFDLEDACAVSQKVAARATVIEAFKTAKFTKGKVRAFRCNGLETPWWKDDLEQVLSGAGEKIDVVVLPKIRLANDVRRVDELITTLEKAKGLEQGTWGVEVLIETAAGVIMVHEIAKASPRLQTLIFGVADYAADTGARDFRQNQDVLFYYPRARILAAARAAGLDAIDSVTVQYKDLAQVERDARAGAQLGYDGKWAIHPAQLAPIHDAYTPKPEELARAKKIVAAYQEANEQGEGAIVVDDEMIDAATIKVEQKKLAIASRAGLI